MNKIFLLVAVLVLTVKSFSQVEQNAAHSKDYYLQKSKTQKTIGWVLLGAGTATLVGGLIKASGTSNDLGDIGDGVVPALIGLGADLASIPFFISSGKNKRRAASVAFNAQPAPLVQQKGWYANAYPAISLKISF